MNSSLRDRVTDVVPRIREEAARTEAERRIPTEILAALMEAGLFALDLPADRARSAAERLDLVRLVAGACGSTGWMTAHAAAAPWLLDLFAPTVRERLRGEPPVDPLVAFTFEPAGRVEDDGQGLLLRGEWSVVAAAAHATWLVLGARRTTTEGPGRPGLAIVPASACRLKAAVDSIGLAASGAQHVHAIDVRVEPDAWVSLDSELTERLQPVGGLVAMALVGAAQGGTAEHLDQVRQRVALTHGGEDVSAAGLSPSRIGRAASQLDAAALVLSGGRPDPDGLPQDRFEQQLYAIDCAVEGAELVFGSVRGHALDNGDPVARLWRDVQVGSHHARALVSWLRAVGT